MLTSSCWNSQGAVSLPHAEAPHEDLNVWESVSLACGVDPAPFRWFKSSCSLSGTNIEELHTPWVQGWL